MRYMPLGWAKKYEFTESDLKVACDMLDTWIDSVAMVIFHSLCMHVFISVA
jgi:dynein heavy chain 1